MPRARELGIPFEGNPGVYNAITDVHGVEVGYSTICIGTPEDSQNKKSKFARTGVTAILPRGKKKSAVFAGRHDFNGNGELTGTHWIDDSGFLHGPIMITNTNSVGTVRDSAAKWMIENNCYYASYRDGKEVNGFGFFYPTVGETYDGILNDINGFNVKEEHVFEALNSAKRGALEEGSVGGGTGMRCYSFKGGTGTSSRIVELNELESTYTVGVLVQANYGRREELQIAGIPFGKEIINCDECVNDFSPKPGEGSIIVVVATDAPVLPWQINKLCRRVSLGIGNLGGGYQNGSGDIFIGFSTANENAFSYTVSQLSLLSDEQLEPLFKAVSQATEEAIINALVGAESMIGRDGNFVPAIPHDQIKSILQNYTEYIKMRYKTT